MKRVALIYILLAQLYSSADARVVVQSQRQLTATAHEIIPASCRLDPPVDLNTGNVLNSIVHNSKDQRTPIDLIKGGDISTNTNGQPDTLSFTYNSTAYLLYIRSLLFPKHFFW